jgi:hypothetical protein
MPSLLPKAPPVYLDTELALSQIGDVDAMNSMLLMLEECLSRDIPSVVSLLDQGDVVTANRLLHGLKGFIPIFCPESLCAHVVRVEGLSKLGSSEELLPAYAALRPELEGLLSEVRAHLLANGITA